MWVMQVALNTDEASLSCIPLTSCYVSQFQKAMDQCWSMAWGLGTPALYDGWEIAFLDC